MTLKKQTKEEIIVISAYCLFVFANIISSSQLKVPGFDLILKIINYGCLLLLIAVFLIAPGVTRGHLFACCLLAGIGAIVSIKSDRLSAVILVVAFVLAGAFVRSELVLKHYVITASSAVILVLFLYLIGVIPYDFIDSGNRFRLYLGFIYTTYCANYFFHILLAYFAIKRKPISVVETVIIAGINEVIYRLTDTRAVYLLVWVLLVFFWVLRAFPGIFRSFLSRAVMLVSMPVFALISILLPYFYNPQSTWMSKLNHALAGRLHLGHKGIETYGITLFGSSTEWSTGRLGIERQTEYFYVDSSYLNMLLSFGLIVLLLIIAGFSFLTYRSMQDNKIALYICLFMLSVHSITDPQLFELRYDPFLIMIGTVLFKPCKETGALEMKKTSISERFIHYSKKEGALH